VWTDHVAAEAGHETEITAVHWLRGSRCQSLWYLPAKLGPAGPRNLES
jgi:hypothetical protein